MSHGIRSIHQSSRSSEQSTHHYAPVHRKIQSDIFDKKFHYKPTKKTPLPVVKNLVKILFIIT